MSDSVSANYFITLHAVAARYRELKPQFPTCMLLFRLGVFYQAFGDDAHLLSSIANVPLRFYEADLSVAEIPVLDCESVLHEIVRCGFQINIHDDRPLKEIQ